MTRGNGKDLFTLALLFPRLEYVRLQVEVDEEASDDGHVDDPDEIEGLRDFAIIAVQVS